jgi:hypothetical protein
MDKEEPAANLGRSSRRQTEPYLGRRGDRRSTGRVRRRARAPAGSGGGDGWASLLRLAMMVEGEREEIERG